MSRIALVVAKAANDVIGDRGRIPWRLPDDMSRFKRLTMGKPCIMGRKTWESLPKKPLPGRVNIVVTRNPHFVADGAMVVHSFGDAIACAESNSPEEVAVIGGEEIYRAALSGADAIYLTEVIAEFPGDARFPAIDSAQWRETLRENCVTDAGLKYRFLTLERIGSRR